MSATAFQRMRREKAIAKMDILKQVQQTKAQEKVLDYKDMSNEQLKELLDSKGIEYKARATKSELIELLQGTV